MPSTRVINPTSGTIAALFLCAVGCNSIVGLDKISIGAAQPADSAGSSGEHAGGSANEMGGAMTSNGGDASSAGSGGAAGGGEGGTPDVPGDCTTNQEC